MVRNRSLIAWIPTAIWALIILVISVMPGDSFPMKVSGHLDKLVHIIIYLILAILLVRSIDLTPELFTNLGSFLFILILGGGYGILMELVQWHIPGRQPSILDIFSNIVGIIIGFILGRKAIWQR